MGMVAKTINMRPMFLNIFLICIIKKKTKRQQVVRLLCTSGLTEREIKQQTIIFGDFIICIPLHCLWQLPSVNINITKLWVSSQKGEHPQTHTTATDGVSWSWSLSTLAGSCIPTCIKHLCCTFFLAALGGKSFRLYLSSDPSSNVSAKWTSPVGTGVLYVTWGTKNRN